MQPKKAESTLKKLSVQFNLIVIGIPTLVLMGFGIFQLKTQSLALERNLENTLKNEASQLSASLSTALFNFDEETCQVICMAALNKPEIIKIAIRDMGEIFQNYAAEEFSRDGALGNTRVMRVPISFKNENIGELELTATTRLMHQRLSALKRSIIIQIFVLDMVLGVVMALVLLIRFVRPLKNLERESEKIATGDLDYPIDVSRQDEIGALAANLLIMRDAVREKVASLKSEIQQHEKTSTTLKQTTDYIDNILNSMPSVVMTVDQNLKITQWNIRTREVTGISADEAVGKWLMTVIPDLAPMQEEILSTIRTKQAVLKARQPYTREGIMGYEDIAVYPLISRYVDGAVIRIDDVTEHVKMEQMVVQSEKMMSVGGLAAGMAHEINNPLAGMMQNAQVILKRIWEDIPASLSAAREAGTSLDVIRDFMDRRGISRQLNSIHSAGIRATQIVQNMLSFARKDYSGKAAHDLSQVLDQTLELAGSDYDLKKQYDFRSIQVVKHYEPGLPQITCEASKLQQVFFNILKNSAEAMQDRTGQDPAKIEVSVARSGPEIKVDISDNGPGMPEEVRKRIFEPFYTTKSVGKGTGLGLSVAYFIITDNHHGRMSVSAAPGKGTRFTIFLPLS